MSSTDDSSGKLIAVGASLLSISILSVAIRFYTRIWVVKWIGTDDWLALIALIFGALETGSYIACKYYN